MSAHITVSLPTIARPPSKDNGYIQRDRPPSYQPRFTKVKTQPLNNYGYPAPGIQSPTARQVIAEDYLISDETWNDLCDHAQDIDFIVIGSGFTALAFIDQTLKQDPFKKILCLERGDFWLPDHFQNLPLPFKYTLGGPSETFPFTLSKNTYDNEIRFVHGSTPFFGGRSTFWSAWSPSPSPDLMRDWPSSLRRTSEDPDFFDKAIKLLHVTSASEIGDPYANLQTAIDARLKQGINKVYQAKEAYSAPLAVSPTAQSTKIRFTKFSTPGPLFGLYEQQQQLAKANKGSPLLFATETTVEYLVTQIGYPTVPHVADKDVSVKFVQSTQRTPLPVAPNTKIILCAGAFPSTTLLVNSFPHLQDIAGQKVTGHFLSHVVGRVKRTAFETPKLKQYDIEIGASYLAGIDSASGLQYHIQVTAIASPNPGQNAEDAARFCPDYAAAASEEQLKGSENYVIFVCATLGELSEDNPDSFFKLDRDLPNRDPTANCVLQIVPQKKDLDLWDVMDRATFDAIKVMAGDGQQIEWWHEPKGSSTPGTWRHEEPGKDTIRMEGVVHEASLLPLGDDGKSCVDQNYKVKDVSNVVSMEPNYVVYVTNVE
ncbi:hypothetical protein FRC12_013650 [Ceratobasidium sp. 428]|nr:hypothetical protein FRC12_013650 [Ceratobasidium sp. 428]